MAYLDLEPQTVRCNWSPREAARALREESFKEFGVCRYGRRFFQANPNAESYVREDGLRDGGKLQQELMNHVVAPLLSALPNQDRGRNSAYISVFNNENGLIGVGFYSHFPTTMQAYSVGSREQLMKQLMGLSQEDPLPPPFTSAYSTYFPREGDFIEQITEQIDGGHATVHSAAPAILREAGARRVFASCCSDRPYGFVRDVEVMSGFQCTILGINGIGSKLSSHVTYMIDLETPLSKKDPFNDVVVPHKLVGVS